VRGKKVVASMLRAGRGQGVQRGLAPNTVHLLTWIDVQLATLGSNRACEICMPWIFQLASDPADRRGRD
jgi:hypothetical protein